MNIKDQRVEKLLEEIEIVKKIKLEFINNQDFENAAYERDKERKLITELNELLDVINMEYYNEKDFTKELIQFKKEYVQLSNRIIEILEHNGANCSPLMVRADKKSLLFCLNLGNKFIDRTSYERGDNLYRNNN